MIAQIAITPVKKRSIAT